MAMGIIAAVVTVAGAAASAYSSYKQGKANQANVASQNAQAAEQRAIDEQYYGQLQVHQGNLQAFAQKQQDFAFARKAYGESVYRQAVADRATQIAYLEKKNYNEKLAAKSEYTAEKTVAKMLQVGAVAQANAVVNDTLRVAGAQGRAIAKESNKMLGTIVAKTQEGVAQGRSKERIMVEAFMARNDAVAQLSDKSASGILAAINAKDKVVNSTNINLQASYRGLQAAMRKQVPPVPHIPPPAPVFTDMAPLAPLAPLGATPRAVQTAGNGALVMGAVGTLAQGAASGYGQYVKYG